MEKAMQIKRLEKLFGEYSKIEAEEKELDKKIQELKSKISELKTNRLEKGNILVKLGQIHKKYSYREQQNITGALMDNLKDAGNGKIDIEKFKVEKAKLDKKFKEIIYTPCESRTWRFRGYQRFIGNTNEKAMCYYFTIDNHDCDSMVEKYSSMPGSFSVTVSARPELKKYKWEVKKSWPNPEKYREDLSESVKCTTLAQAADVLAAMMEQVEAEFKAQSKEVFELAPDIFDFSKAQHFSDDEVTLPFEIKGKEVI